ncbi:Aste57867_10289 [Aphanomyces stellatus]|uniref:Aste57867_10289 protein n=1 Tax=Aphanomyces stellatus TaxID=120398 RepID=A0A485KPY2_9STRA|nr:hypothetical protein As57867_010249 [Aphanomyces stellatus]VFT87163.1 Aste57867_10289 [Aphanomyces stellatus]
MSSTAPLLSLVNVCFKPNGTDTFRVALTQRCSSTKDPILSIWIECKRTKSQWIAAITNFTDHAPEDADYILPPGLLLDALQGALCRASGIERPRLPMKSAVVSFSAAADGDSMGHLVLKFKPSGWRSYASYVFDMTRCEHLPVDI